ncbi:NADP-dependent oxidoreductase [Granulicella tundricola]|uniref:Alcohol dehydrogenase GroES domain protein n=1 Tax=Granulicella tundricola (strain ATCC BAA-1859 / DSM 23138 / MP5ACTX9) TaxID=1198114 RepID=E8WWL7_GRATM|nr:NADP-dependent oxidoreductase [Granulicella tundricola]ADW70762.1 Alcohol dehydrogenase GroES domain protein [Granulicella tundricola MP5ACTX9]
MKAVVLHKYGGPDELKVEEWDDPVAGEGQVLIKISSVSINPIDWKMRSGEAKQRFPVEFPGIIGRDVSGIVRAVGAGVENFLPGDKVFTFADHTYAELCVVKASDLAKISEGLDVVKAGALPLVLLTGTQLIRLGAKIQSGQTVLVTGALGAVGRTAVYVARKAGAHVIAGVRKSQLDEAKKIGADEVIALDDSDAVAKLGFLDAIADTVGGETAQTLIGKVKQGGIFATVTGPPQNASQHPTVQIGAVKAVPNPEQLVELAEDVLAGKLEIPIDRMIPLEDAGKGQAAAEKGGLGGKILLIP